MAALLPDLEAGEGETTVASESELATSSEETTEATHFWMPEAHTMSESPKDSSEDKSSQDDSTGASSMSEPPVATTELYDALLEGITLLPALFKLPVKTEAFALLAAQSPLVFKTAAFILTLTLFALLPAFTLEAFTSSAGSTTLDTLSLLKLQPEARLLSSYFSLYYA